jgi:hypothetical protein
MKKFSTPPMIIILDVLFVVLFILVLESSPNLKITLPSNIYLKDMLIVTVNKNKKIQHWFDNKDKRWKSFEKEFKSNRKFAFVLGNIDCNINNFCKELSNPFVNEKKRIYLKGDLYDEISGMISDSCLKFPKQCSNVTYYIKDDGMVDKERLKKDHQIFRYILLEEK